MVSSQLDTCKKLVIRSASLREGTSSVGLLSSIQNITHHVIIRANFDQGGLENLI